MSKKFNDSVFVNYSPTKAERARCKIWAAEHWTTRDWLTWLVDAGYKFSVGFDARNNAYCCWIIPLAGDNPNAGLILSGRGSTAPNAVIECFFKHVILFKGTWPRPENSSGEPLWDKE